MLRKKTIAPYFGDLFTNLAILEPLLAYSSVFAEGYDALDKKMKKDAKLNKFITSAMSRPEFNKKKSYLNYIQNHLNTLIQ